LLAAPTSPLKRLLTLVESQTNLLKPTPQDATAKAQKGIASSIDALGKMFGSTPQDQAAAPPGTKITRHFEPLHKLVAGAPAPIDMTLEKFGAIQKTMAEINALGGPPPLELATRLSVALKDLDLHAKTLPAPVASVVSRTTGEGTSVVKASIGSDFASRYNQQVVSECRELAAGRYPVTRGSGVDLPLADFARLFGPNGVFDGFFHGTMQPFVDVNRSPWQWKAEAASLGGPRTAPIQMQRADRIKQTYFGAGTPQPEVRFSLMPVYLDANVNRLVVEIDGQTLEYRHGAQRNMPMAWPGPNPGQAAITLEDKSGATPNIIEQGPWAFYRLLEKATIQPQSDVSFMLTFNVGGRTARLALQASSSRNPFAGNALQGFGCAN
jgi:type VI secretion system protein ImpL